MTLESNALPIRLKRISTMSANGYCRTLTTAKKSIGGRNTFSCFKQAQNCDQYSPQRENTSSLVTKNSVIVTKYSYKITKISVLWTHLQVLPTRICKVSQANVEQQHYLLLHSLPVSNVPSFHCIHHIVMFFWGEWEFCH